MRRPATQARDRIRFPIKRHALCMKPQSCKAKGRRLQQMIVRDLLELFPHLSEDDVRSTSMGAGGEDIQLSPLARKSIPYSIEAKNQERLNLWAALDQAKANTPSGSDPIVVLKKNQSKPHVLLSWECFLKLIARPSTDGAQTSPKEQIIALATNLQLLASMLE